MSQLALQLIEKEKAERTGYLELGNCGLTPDNPQLQVVWDALSELTHLETLNLSNKWWDWEKEKAFYNQNKGKKNRLDSIPNVVANLFNLKKLVIAGDHGNQRKIQQIDNLPDSLHSLNISNNQIQHIENLPNGLHSLYIYSNQIQEIDNLPDSLNLLDISDNQIRQIGNLPDSLHSLDINYNQIQQIGNLPDNLHTLNIYNNQIQQVGNLPDNLHTLNIYNNQIQQVGNLPDNLHTLNIYNNQIQQIDNLPNSLFLLDISDNQIRDLKPLVPFIKKEIGYHLTGNPLESPPVELANQGRIAILRYFEELVDGSAPLREAKLLILGSGGVGKTSLMVKLQNPKNRLPVEKDTTVGITVTQQPKTFDIDGERYTMNIWDFGGQDIYHPVHQFFLTKNSIYVLVQDGREQKTDFYYWLQVQKLLAADSPLFIFQNIKNGSRCHIPIRELKGEFENIKDYFELDLSEVKESHTTYERMVTELKAKLQTLPHIGEMWPRTRYAIRDALMGMRERHHISLRDYKALCCEHNYTDEEGQKELLRQLHFLGVVLHFEDTPFLENIVIVNPEWATDAVYAILNHTKKHYEKNGRFTWEDLCEVWQEEKYEGKYNEILTLMNKFELSFALQDETYTYIAPLLLPDDKPQYEWDTIANLQMKYDYDFMLKGIMARLIVRLNRLIKKELFWKRGVVFTYENTDAEVMEDYMGRHVSIRVKGKEAKVLISWIRTEIDAINAAYNVSERISVRKLVPCNCGKCVVAKEPYFYNYETLRRWIDVLKRDTIQCQVSAENVELRQLLDNIQSTKVKPEFRRKKIFISYSKHDRSNIENELKPLLRPLERQGKVELFYDRDILPGDEWDAEIRAKLQAADIILLMVSTKFLATDYIQDVEIEKAIERHKAGKSKVVPIILSHCDWEGGATPFSILNALPSKGKRISDYADKDEAWLKVLEGIKKLL